MFFPLKSISPELSVYLGLPISANPSVDLPAPLGPISPVGWRIPTVEDFESLLDDSRVKREWINQNGVKGYRFTDLMTGNSIFLLECGYRDGDGGLLSKNGFYYWTSTKYTESFARYFNGEMSPTYYRRAGFSIRCVAK